MFNSRQNIRSSKPVFVAPIDDNNLSIFNLPGPLFIEPWAFDVRVRTSTTGKQRLYDHQYGLLTKRFYFLNTKF